jgi:hypothetical protein
MTGSYPARQFVQGSDSTYARLQGRLDGRFVSGGDGEAKIDDPVTRWN